MCRNPVSLLEGADEDLRAAWRLSEAACAVHVPDHPSPRPGASPSMSAGGGAGGGGGGGAADDDALKESGSPALDVGGTLKRLEATSMGSLAVAVFKRELLRLTGLGGADQMGGALGMAGNEALRLLRRAEARHPEQGELFLLHGDVLAQGEQEANTIHPCHFRHNTAPSHRPHSSLYQYHPPPPPATLTTPPLHHPIKSAILWGRSIASGQPRRRPTRVTTARARVRGGERIRMARRGRRRCLHRLCRSLPPSRPAARCRT